MAAITAQLEQAEAARFERRVEVPSADPDVRSLAKGVNRLLAGAQAALEHAEAQNERLRKQNAELEQFAYVASHDLQEPLRMVSSFLTLLERRHSDQLDDNAREYITFAVDGAERMKNLIQDLLKYSRVGRNSSAAGRVDMEDVVHQAIKQLGVPILESDAAIRCDDLPAVYGVKEDLVLLMTQLLSNAITFSGDNAPEISVRARLDDDQWHFEVQDNGIGIEPQHAERVFQIFHQLHPRDDYPGTGIGLALAKKVVELHGGRIWVTESPAGGASLNFTLPDSTAGAR
jgi:light-regulated signal transduction histidine kinase (bacteriophytochrome)